MAAMDDDSHTSIDEDTGTEGDLSMGSDEGRGVTGGRLSQGDLPAEPSEDSGF